RASKFFLEAAIEHMIIALLSAVNRGALDDRSLPRPPDRNPSSSRPSPESQTGCQTAHRSAESRSPLVSAAARTDSPGPSATSYAATADLGRDPSASARR